MDPIIWLEAFKGATDTKTFIFLLVVFTILATLWLRTFVGKFLRKDKFHEAWNLLKETIEANTESMTQAAKAASDRCREDTNLVKVSLEGYHDTVGELSKAVASLSGEVKAYTHAIKTMNPRPRRKK